MTDQIPVAVTAELVKPKDWGSVGMEALYLTLLPAMKFEEDDWHQVADPVRMGFHDSFEREGTPTEEWAPLCRVTQDEREALGYPREHPILRRSGKYLQSWVLGKHPNALFEIHTAVQFEGTTYNSVYVAIGSKDPRAERLSLGDDETALMARPVHIISEERMKELEFEFRRMMLIKIIEHVG